MIGIKKKTAYSWIKSGRSESKQREGKKPTKLTAQQIDELVLLVEEDNQLTLKQLSSKIFILFGIQVSIAKIHNYLANRVITLKTCHVEPSTMNSDENKQRRKMYVEKISESMLYNKHLIWMDETNLNLFYRRTQVRSKAGERAVIRRPTSRGQNTHVIGAISANGVIK